MWILVEVPDEQLEAVQNTIDWLHTPAIRPWLGDGIVMVITTPGQITASKMDWKLAVRVLDMEISGDEICGCSDYAETCAKCGHSENYLGQGCTCSLGE